jgi:Tfp pilus assembly protein PilO
MISSASPHQRMMIGTVLAGFALLAAMWMLALSPKRQESATVRDNVAAQQTRLDTANSKLAGYESARKQYPGMLSELRRLDKAVPGRGEIPGLLRQLQRRAKAMHSDLTLAALKPVGSSAGSPDATLTPGASLQAGGLATLPFSFTYTGKYFDLVHVLAAARKTVTVKSGDLKIDGRLVTIEGITFERATADSPVIKAAVSGTAYIAVSTPQTPAAATAAPATQGGS